MSKKRKPRTMKLGDITFVEEKRGKLEYTQEDIQRIAEIHDDRITDEWLEHVGFVKVKKDIVKRDVWRLKVPFYGHDIEFTKGDYPRTNPNCGVVSIHDPEHEVFTADKEGRGYVGKEHASTISIAWYVTTKRRLTTIIQSLTEVNCC